MKATCSQKRRTTGRHGSLNAVVYSLLVLAVLLGGVATWQRYSARQNAEPGDAAERRLDPLLARLGVPDSWVPVGGRPQGAGATLQSRFICAQCQATCWMNAQGGCPGCPFCGSVMTRQGSGAGLTTVGGGMPQNMMAIPRCSFVCPQCQAACLTGASIGSPPCPFCGVAMSRQGLDRQDVWISPIGGMGAAGDGAIISIQPDAVCPHADRGACSNCHTMSTTATPGMTPAAAARNTAGAAWQGIAAPAIPANTAAPTLIEEMGMEICQTQGAGVRVTGIMGNSFAAKAGMSAGDIIIRFNGTRVRDVGQFDRLVLQASPEAEAQLVIMRNGRTRDLLVMVDEGEMDGFLPIQRP